MLFLGVMLLSCSSDNSDSSVVTTQRLLGKWYIKGGTVNNGTFENYVHACAEFKDFQEFLSIGKLTFNGYNVGCDLADTDTSNWVLNGNILTVSSESDNQATYQYIYTVEYLTESELLLQQTVVESNVTTIYRISFTRD